MDTLAFKWSLEDKALDGKSPIHKSLIPQHGKPKKQKGRGEKAK